MPKEHEKIKHLPGEKSLKVPFIIYADLDVYLKKCDLVKMILKILTQRKKLSTNLQDTHGVQYAHLIIQKTNAIFIGERIRKEKFCDDDKNKKKVRDHCHFTGKFRGTAHNGCNWRYKVPKEIRIVFPNGLTYDYHFVIKKLAEEFKGEFECLGENTEKYIAFSVPLKKMIKKSYIN